MLVPLWYIYIDVLTTNNTYQCGYSEYLNRQSSDGYTPLMVIIYEVLLQLLKVLKRLSYINLQK